MSAPCPTCQAVIASCPDDDSLYSIQSSIFPFVFECPAGYDCGNSTSFNMVCCGTLFSVDFPANASADDKTTLIQGIVNQCAVLLSACGQNPGCLNPPCDPPPPTTVLYYNRDATCSVNCPDTTTFVYTVVAGTFADLTQEGADQKALGYACQQVALRRICINNFTNCLCVGSAFTRQVAVVGGLPPIRFSLTSGFLPDGLTLSIGGLISGTPTVPGVFGFSIRATSAYGGSVTKHFSLSVLQVMTTTIDDYTVGNTYSFQMLAAGGSGMYNWSISEGTLPDGLTMSSEGLISGTPTGGAGTQPITFMLIDTACEAAVQSVFPPRVRISSRSTTTIATILGYPEYLPSLPPKKYKSLAWSGTAQQSAVAVNGQQQVSNAKYEYSGASTIDSSGHQVTLYSKNLSTPCPTTDFQPTINSVPNFGLSSLLGFCWPTEPRTCPTCEDPPIFKADVAKNMVSDFPSDMIGASSFNEFTPTSVSNNQGLSELVALQTGGPDGVTNVPITTINGITAPWIRVTGAYNYTSTLSDEYTDAEALANAFVLKSNGRTAENKPRTTGFVSRTTNVVFTLSADNLVVGSRYVITARFADQNFHITTKQYGISPTATTAALTDVVPTPSVGGTQTLVSATIAFLA